MDSACYRRGQARYGFFLEYDRGTERAREYAAKLEAYYRYRDSGAAARDYAGFPTVLVVTTRAAAEARFAHEAYLAWERRGGKPLPILLTTTHLIETHPEGILGPIWRTPASPSSAQSVRGYWLPGRPPRRHIGIDRKYTKDATGGHAARRPEPRSVHPLTLSARNLGVQRRARNSLDSAREDHT